MNSNEDLLEMGFHEKKGRNNVCMQDIKTQRRDEKSNNGDKLRSIVDRMLLRVRLLPVRVVLLRLACIHSGVRLSISVCCASVSIDRVVVWWRLIHGLLMLMMSLCIVVSLLLRFCGIIAHRMGLRM
jgi:hypothetical protein